MKVYQSVFEPWMVTMVDTNETRVSDWLKCVTEYIGGDVLALSLQQRML